MPPEKIGYRRARELTARLHKHLMDVESNPYAFNAQRGLARLHLKLLSPAERKFVTQQWRKSIKRKERVVNAVETHLPAIKKKYPFVKGSYLFGSTALGKKNPHDADVILLINWQQYQRHLKKHPEQKYSRTEETSRAPVEIFRHRPYTLAQRELSEALERDIGLPIGTQMRGRTRIVEFGIFFFDPRNPDVATASLLRQNNLSRGQLSSEPDKRGLVYPKLEFKLRPWNFIATPTRLQDHFKSVWKEIKDLDTGEKFDLVEKLHRRERSLKSRLANRFGPRISRVFPSLDSRFRDIVHKESKRLNATEPYFD
jgi:hypothetical protein